MKIFFRYLFVRLFVPFAICLGACTLIWVMADLYGNIDDFLGHNVNVFKILYFYALQIPNMLVQVLPAALLFSTLWTLISLNRRCELVAFQSGGMAPIWLFSPFFVFALIWAGVLAVDLNWPAAMAQVTRERLLAQVKGQDAKSNVFVNLPYVDSVNRQIWFFQSLDTNQGTAKGVEILQRDANGHDVV
jgi:lipopolysaccharide export system permease protein